MNYITKSIFNFKGFGVQKVLNKDREISVYLAPRRKTATCSKCGKKSKKIHETGLLRKVRHSRYEGKQIVVLVPKRRFFCSCCNLRFSEKIDWIPFKARSTINFVQETISCLKRSSFTAIQEMYDTNYQFLSKNLKSLDTDVKWPDGILRLGFDEHSYAKRHMMVTITELRTNTLLAILPKYNKESIENYLEERSSDELERVEELCFDMKFKQRKTVERFFPCASTVVDKFHVLCYLAHLIDVDRRFDAPKIKSFENIRQMMRKPEKVLTEKEWSHLDNIFKQYPELKKKWDIYQRLSLFYRSKSKEEAKKKLVEIRNSLSILDRCFTKDFLRTINRLEEEILNYFNNRTTNAFTEGVHTKIKMIKRTSFGFRNTEVYIKKVMLAFIPMVIILSQLLPH